MADINGKPGTRTTITIAPASLATSSTFVAGVESDQIDNASAPGLSAPAIDVLVQGKVTVGTTPTASTQIRVYVWGSDQSLGTAALDVLDGTSSAETITSAGIRNGLLKLGAVLDVDATTSDRTYPVGAFSIAELFGGTMPKFWGLFLTHNTGVNLNATGGNHEFAYVPYEASVA